MRIAAMTSQIVSHLAPGADAPPSSFIPPDSQRENTTLLCDLTKGNAFVPERNGPPVPVIAAFGAGRMHMCKRMGAWDFDRAAAENPDLLIRSFRLQGPTGRTDRWEDVIFQFGERAFLCGDQTRIVGYAVTQAETDRIVKQFTETYGLVPDHPGGSFQLIRHERFEIKCENVILDPESVLGERAFALHYPAGGTRWHGEFVNRLIESRHGLSILEGMPGTGKTSYLRHLMGTLKDSHRFYFIPPSSLGIISKPDFIGFWANERQTYADRKLVVILEDADAALMTRASDNREQVSAILNLSDGMLGDFLQLQIICTINCRAADIDQALLRPGRLLCHRVFERLDPEQASRLAMSLGKTLPPAQDYSLAEVFSGHEGNSIPRPHIGFGSSK